MVNECFAVHDSRYPSKTVYLKVLEIAFSAPPTLKVHEIMVDDVSGESKVNFGTYPAEMFEKPNKVYNILWIPHETYLLQIKNFYK